MSGATDQVRLPKQPSLEAALFGVSESSPAPGEDPGRPAARRLAQLRAGVQPVQAGRLAADRAPTTNPGSPEPRVRR